MDEEKVRNNPQYLAESYKTQLKEFQSCTQDHLHHLPPPPNLPLPLPFPPQHSVALVTTTDHNNDRQSTPVCEPQQSTLPQSLPNWLSGSDNSGEQFAED